MRDGFHEIVSGWMLIDGIDVATAQGDLQPAREMTVFLNRLQRTGGVGP